MKGLTEPWLSQGGQTGHERYCGDNVRCWEEAGGGREDSGLGHGAGLLLVDVAAHTTGVDAWKNQRDSRGWVRGEQRGRERPFPGGSGCLDHVLIQVWRIIGGRTAPPSGYLWAQRGRRSMVCGSKACRHAGTRKEAMLLLIPVPSGRLSEAKRVERTSAWLPGARVLLHRSHRRQGRCQSLPSDVTFSASGTPRS